MGFWKALICPYSGGRGGISFFGKNTRGGARSGFGDGWGGGDGSGIGNGIFFEGLYMYTLCKGTGSSSGGIRVHNTITITIYTIL